MVLETHVRDALFELDASERYKGFDAFQKIDIALKKRASYTNAYGECRRYFQNDHEGIYGETPLQTIESILRVVGVGPDWTFVDVGCGRGRLCYFVRDVFGAKCVGVDLVPEYMTFAQKLPMDGVEFIHDSYERIRISGDRVVMYWYAVTIGGLEQKRMAKHFPKNAIVITISEPIEGWEVMDVTPALFPWGESVAYINYRPNMVR